MLSTSYLYIKCIKKVVGENDIEGDCDVLSLVNFFLNLYLNT